MPSGNRDDDDDATNHGRLGAPAQGLRSTSSALIARAYARFPAVQAPGASTGVHDQNDAGAR
ncbi:hypothetical protein [Streptomyces sp. NPDC056061]|uniref:hypothetical protein n=1 Tax=Streptomyces sp. NPDC056061 TaxID=3345700 RepID=UPI0035E1E8D0